MAPGGKSYHFVLVHGACHGAWCWYKTKDLLEKAGHKATALDLAACGVHRADVTSITSFDPYNRPLIDFLATDVDAFEKVILVGHSLGGLSLIDASARYPSRITVAVHLAAIMMFGGVANIGQEELKELRQHSSQFAAQALFSDAGDINDQKVAMEVPDDIALEVFYNLSPSQDIVLSGLLRRPVPACCLRAELKHAQEIIESVPRVYVKLEKDNCLLPSLQDDFIQRHPPDQVVSLDTDHSPFFSMPEQLHDLLLKIAQTYDP